MEKTESGMAKSMSMMGMEAGFDMTNQADVAEFMNMYNSSIHAEQPSSDPVTPQMTAEEKRVFNKKLKKQFAKKLGKGKR